MSLALLILAQAEQTRPRDFLDYALDGSIIGLMAIIVIGAVYEWWVPGRTHRRTIAEKDREIERVVSERDRALALNEAQNEATRRALEVAIAARPREGGTP